MEDIEASADLSEAVMILVMIILIEKKVWLSSAVEDTFYKTYRAQHSNGRPCNTNPHIVFI
jgi:hypothetical protein